VCNRFYDAVSIKYEGEELKELSVKFTGCCLDSVFFLSFIVFTCLCYFVVHKMNSIYHFCS